MNLLITSMQSEATRRASKQTNKQTNKRASLWPGPPTKDRKRNHSLLHEQHSAAAAAAAACASRAQCTIQERTRKAGQGKAEQGKANQTKIATAVAIGARAP